MNGFEIVNSIMRLLYTGDIGPLEDDGGQAKNEQEYIKKLKPKLLKKQEHCGSLILRHENNNQPLFSGSNTTLVVVFATP